MVPLEIAEAIKFVKYFATDGMKTYPFDGFFKTTREQIVWIEADIATLGHIRRETADCLVIGIMAAKELGND